MIRIHRLQSAKDFRVLFRLGHRRETNLFRLTALPNHLPYSRFAFIAPKTVDKRAVARNRLRRRCREWTRAHFSSPTHGMDIAIFFKQEAGRATKKEFYHSLTDLFRYHAEK